MKFGDYLKQAREAKGWTQPVAADQIGMEQSYLSKLETGKSYPSEEMFDKLVASLGLDAEELARVVAPQELQELHDIKRVRTAIVGQHEQAFASTRNWMRAGLAALMLGGACLGGALLPSTAERQFQYRSEGVLEAGEPLEAFKKIRSEDKQLQEEMLARIDQDDRLLPTRRGHSFVESTPDGRRYYELIGVLESSGHSPMRFLIIPALMLLFGGVGCFLIAFRSRKL